MDPNPVTDPTTVLRLVVVAGVCVLVPEAVEPVAPMLVEPTVPLDPPQAARQVATTNARALRTRMFEVGIGDDPERGRKKHVDPRTLRVGVCMNRG
jgi:hypothetical protein